MNGWQRGTVPQIISVAQTFLTGTKTVYVRERDIDAYHVTIRRTAHGIPHIIAGDYGSLGYGYAHAFAQDAICPMGRYPPWYLFRFQRDGAERGKPESPGQRGFLRRAREDSNL